MMIDEILRRAPRLCLLLPFAALFVPDCLHSQQNLAFAGCVERSAKIHDWGLNAPAALQGLGMHPEIRTLGTCVRFCMNKTVPSRPVGATRWHIATSGDMSAFTPPYTYVALAGGLNWCFCGKTFQAPESAHMLAANCSQAAGCLSNPEEECKPSEAGKMIFMVTSGGGGRVGGGGAPQPPPPTGNRTPYAPTVQPGGFEPPFPLRYEGAVQLTWQNNGDPDGDPLTFGVFVMYFDWAQRMWVQVPSLRDYMGVYGRVWVTEPYYTFTTQAGLRPNTWYSWMVFACDMNRGDNTLCSWSGWSQFRTVE